MEGWGQVDWNIWDEINKDSVINEVATIFNIVGGDYGTIEPYAEHMKNMLRNETVYVALYYKGEDLSHTSSYLFLMINHKENKLYVYEFRC